MQLPCMTPESASREPMVVQESMLALMTIPMECWRQVKLIKLNTSVMEAPPITPC